MQCPYCASAIADEALVCPTCRRDLFLVKPLLERIATLEAELAARPALPVAEQAPGDSALADVVSTEAASDVMHSLPAAAAIFAALLALLLLGHWLFVFVYDANVLYLRIFALLLPLPFGFVFARASGFSLPLGVTTAVCGALLAVLGMSGVTSLIDAVPVLPQDMVEVREFLEFSASIGFAFLTGFWLHHWAEQRRIRHQAALERLRAAGVGGLGEKLADSMTRWSDFGSAAVAFVTTVLSIYTGLKDLIG